MKSKDGFVQAYNAPLRAFGHLLHRLGDYRSNQCSPAGQWILRRESSKRFPNSLRPDDSGLHAGGHDQLQRGRPGVRSGRDQGRRNPASIGVLIKDSYNVTLSNVGSFNHGICFEAQSDTVFGISLHAVGLSTGARVDAHFVDSSWPEIFLLNSRFGMDGLGDVNSNAYVRFTGGTIGPNTFYAQNNQFDQGSASVGTFIEFKSLTTPTNLITSEFTFVGNHVETMHNVVKTDSTATQISRLKLIGNTLLDTFVTSEFWSFGAATNIYDLSITGNTVYQGSFTFKPGGQISSAVVSNNQFLNLSGGATFNGTGGGALSALGNVYNGSVTLSGSWGVGEFGGLLLTGSLGNTTSGSVAVNFPGAAGLASCASTLGVAFGGSSVGITFNPSLHVSNRWCTPRGFALA
jgi:hypothetical protein